MMEGRARTAWYTFIVIFGTSILLLGGFVVIKYEDFRAIEVSSQVELFDYDRRLHDSINALSHCATSCVFNQITNNGCAHSDYVCMCQKFQVLGDPCVATNTTQVEFKSCIEGCTLHDQWHSPGIILDICQAVDVRVVLPEFMLQNFRIHGRQASGTDGFPETNFGYTPTYTPTRTTTVTTEVAPGDPEITYTETGRLRVTVVVAKSDTAARSSPTDESDSSSSSNGEPSRNRGGLASGARIGIGVVIPVVFLLLAWAAGWYWRRRKRNQPAVSGMEAEKNDGSPPVAELGDRPHFPPAYHPPENNNLKISSTVPEIQTVSQSTSYGGIPTYGENAAHELNSNSSAPRHELTATSTPRTELPEMPPQAYSPSIGRKPISPAATQSTSSPPWDNSHGGSEYIPYRSPDPESSLPEVVPQASSPNIGTDDETRRLEEEMARIQAQKQRLNELHALEAREEELRKRIEARRAAGDGGT